LSQYDMRNFLSKMLATGLLLATILSSGCLTDELNRRHYQDYFQGGLAALDAGDYPAAKKRFLRAAFYAQEGDLGPRAEAAAVYNYAQAVGQLGEFPEAEKFLKRAMTLDEKADGRENPFATSRLLELARLYQAWGKYEQSVEEYEAAMPFLKQINIGHDDPIGYAMVLEDYAKVLKHVGSETKASSAQSFATGLRAANPGMKPKVKLREYPEKKN